MVKAWPGQAAEAESIAVQVDEILFLLHHEPNGDWSKVRRERDGKEGIIPTKLFEKRLQKAPPPPPPEEDEAQPAGRGSPQLSDESGGEEQDGNEDDAEGAADMRWGSAPDHHPNWHPLDWQDSMAERVDEI